MSGSLRTLRKHWILTSLLVLLTLVGCAGAWFGIKGPYQSESQVVFLASRSTSKINGDNPYMSFTGALSTTADLVRREVMDPRETAALAARGYTASYQVVNDPLATGPILDVQATGHDQAAVENTQHGVTDAVQSELSQLQASVAPENQITSLVVSSDPKATLMVSKKARPLAAVLVIGLLLTLAIPQIVDAIQVRRQERSIADDDTGPVPVVTGSLPMPATAEPARPGPYSVSSSALGDHPDPQAPSAGGGSAPDYRSVPSYRV